MYIGPYSGQRTCGSIHKYVSRQSWPFSNPLLLLVLPLVRNISNINKEINKNLTEFYLISAVSKKI